MTVVTAIILCLVALALGVGAGMIFFAKQAPALPETERQKLLEAARAEAAELRRQAELEADEKAQRAIEQADKELADKRSQQSASDAALRKREEELSRRQGAVQSKESELDKKERQVAQREQAADANVKKSEELLRDSKAKLERTAGLSAEQAKAELMAEIADEARKASAAEVRRIEEEARSEAEGRAQKILGTAIQRYASEYVTERAVSVVSLPSDDLKGRIIGREGRNIRALEAATGIDLIIDDTPEAVVISCFNPVRREIAKRALEKLIADGRIHPSRIEEVVQKCEEEVEQVCKEAGEQAVFDLGLHKVHAELVRTLGRLKFRSSGGHNLLQHSIEVAHLCGIIAGELGVNVKVARRAGLLHDVGRGVDQDNEGSHAAAGAQLAKKYNESPQICAAIAEHHGEEKPTSVLSHIVAAANALSSQRPGARQELLASYVQRLQDLEKIAQGFAGVQKAYAIQAGREIRVLVENSQITDDQSVILAKDIAKRIEAEGTYPGQVRVSVIRETRSTDYAR